jgi:hypothetical protein
VAIFDDTELVVWRLYDPQAGFAIIRPVEVVRPAMRSTLSQIRADR